MGSLAVANGAGRPACASVVEVAASAVPGTVVAGMVLERSITCTAASTSHDRPKYRAAVDTWNLNGSQSAGTELQSQFTEEAAFTNCAGRENVVIINEGQGVLRSQASCGGEEIEFGSESQTVSACESNRNVKDLSTSRTTLVLFLM